MKICFNCAGSYEETSFVCPVCTACDGFYLLSKKEKPTGANRVEFKTCGGYVNVNFSGWRKANPGEIKTLQDNFLGELKACNS